MDITPSKQTMLPASIPTLVLILATILSLYLCFRLAAPFIAALTFAMALAVLFMPLQKWLEAKLKRASLAAMINTVAIAAIVVIPLIFVGEKLLVQAATSAEQIEAKAKSGEWRRSLETQPQLAQIVEVVEQRIDLPGILKTFTTKLSTVAGSIVKGSVMQLIGICLTFYLLFFFLRDRVVALNALRAMSPLSNAEMDHLLERLGDTIYAIVYGTLAVAAAHQQLQ